MTTAAAEMDEADEGLHDGAKAVELALKANEVSSSGNPYFVRTLAAAYAEVGRFDDAARTARAAIAAAKTEEPALVSRNEERARLYAAQQAYHGGVR